MNYREKRGAYLNCEKSLYAVDNPYGFPEILPQDVDLDDAEVIGFNYAIGEKHPENKIVHFYLDDYQFERVWNDPNRYIPLLRRFKAIMSPDFSMYSDFPKAVQIFNNYRKMWCGAYWQDHGITVIPTVGWSDESSYEWCFDGMPKHSMVSISTVGGFGNHKYNNKDLWLKGFNKCMEVLEPSSVLLFGKYFTEIGHRDIIKVVDNSNLTSKSTKSKRPTKEEKKHV